MRVEEEILAGIFEEVLGVERVGSEESFFDLGATRCWRRRWCRGCGSAGSGAAASGGVRAADGEGTRGGGGREREASGEARSLPEWSGWARGGSWRCRLRSSGCGCWSSWREASGLYNVGAGLRLSGDLDVGALERSLGEIVRRHEALRTCFERREGRVVQRVERSAGRWAASRSRT